MALSSPARLLNNIVWNGVGRAVTVAAALVLTPYLLHRLGQEAFGLWAFANLLVGYLSLADLGIQASLVRQIAFARPDRDPEKFSQIVSTSFFFYFALFALTAPVALALGPRLTAAVAALNPDAIPPALSAEAGFVLTFVAATVFLSIGLAVFSSILPAVQRMDLSNQINIAMSLLNLAACIAVVEWGYGVRGLIVVVFALRVLTALASYIPARSLYPALRVSPKAFDWGVWRELFQFGSRIFVSRVTELGTFTFDRLFLGLAGGVAALGRYAPAAQAATQARLLPHLLVMAALPYASELSAQKDRKALLALYFRGTLYVTFFAFAALGFVAAAAPLLVRVWLGPGYDDVALWIRIFCVGYFVNAPLSLGGLLSQAIGRPGIQARSALLGAGLNLVLSPAGFFLAGVTGLTIGATVAVVAASVWFFLKLNQALKISAQKVIKECFLRPAGWLLAPALLMAFGVEAVRPVMETTAQAWLAVAAAAALFSLCAAAGATRMDLWNVRAQLAAAAPSGEAPALPPEPGPMG